MRLVIAVHIAILLLMYASPFWLDWRLICLLAVVNFVQFYLFGGCILAKYQFKGTEIGFQEWLLSKLGIKVNHQRFKRFALFILPFLIVGVAIIWQVGLGMSAAISL